MPVSRYEPFIVGLGVQRSEQSSESDDDAQWNLLLAPFPSSSPRRPNSAHPARLGDQTIKQKRQKTPLAQSLDSGVREVFHASGAAVTRGPGKLPPLMPGSHPYLGAKGDPPLHLPRKPHSQTSFPKARQMYSQDFEKVCFFLSPRSYWTSPVS